MTSRKSSKPTPNGGASSEMFFLDDDRELCDESVATKCEIVEYDADGDIINRTYGDL